MPEELPEAPAVEEDAADDTAQMARSSKGAKFAPAGRAPRSAETLRRVVGGVGAHDEDRPGVERAARREQLQEPEGQIVGALQIVEQEHEPRLRERGEGLEHE
ncbi:MAG: hypothetical protein U0166_25935 [Acidobacteriota bacterium]